ncbi:MAG: zinc transport system substrate-binding protein [Thiomicrorhabdus sp.]|nr:MAG: zinc transport system substrate-binding protein [Thiomicrorhabdus sp.]
MNRLFITFTGCLSALLLSTSAYAAKVTVSIPPLAGIIAPLLDEDDTLEVILKSGVSPHGFQLRPSHMMAVANSDLVVTVGFGADTWLQKALKSYKGAQVNMADLSRMRLYSVRRGGVWQAAEIGGHDHEKAADMSGVDPHLWTAASNAIEVVIEVSDQLIALSPEKTKVITERRDKWLARIKQVDHEVFMVLNPVSRTPYLVLHDAFQYFEKRYLMTVVGSISLNPEIAPSLKRVFELRERIEKDEISCVFKEPQFSDKRVQPVVDGLNVKVGQLDPMGINYDADGRATGYLLYDDFLKQTALQFVNCLADK